MFIATNYKENQVRRLFFLDFAILILRIRCKYSVNIASLSASMLSTHCAALSAIDAARNVQESRSFGGILAMVLGAVSALASWRNCVVAHRIHCLVCSHMGLCLGDMSFFLSAILTASIKSVVYVPLVRRNKAFAYAATCLFSLTLSVWHFVFATIIIVASILFRSSNRARLGVGWHRHGQKQRWGSASPAFPAVIVLTMWLFMR